MKYNLENERQYAPRNITMHSNDDGESIHCQYGITAISERVIRKQAYSSTLYGFLAIEAVCNHFIRNPNPLVVPVYDFVAEILPKNKYDAHRYHYDMMRMGVLDESEKEFINKVCDPWYRYKTVEERAAWFAIHKGVNDKLLYFLEEVLMQGRYADHHSGNFMKDEDDNYRIIDLEGFTVWHPLTDKRKSWLFE